MKRSVVVAGHRTSVSLEPEFWRELGTLAERRGQSMNQIVADVDAGRAGSLSSALRVYVLRALREEIDALSD